MIYRRGNVYIAHNTARGTAFAYSDATGRITPDSPLDRLAQPDPREWLPVLDSEPLPTGLLVHLILKLSR